jgi:hypothetical protein
LEPLTAAGTLLSNIAFNLAQNDKLSAATRELLKETQVKWDAEHLALAKALATGGRKAGRMDDDELRARVEAVEAELDDIVRDSHAGADYGDFSRPQGLGMRQAVRRIRAALAAGGGDAGGPAEGVEEGS